MTSLAYREIRFGSESDLQIVGLWEFPEAERGSAASDDRYWLVYIHGGAWRDPRCLTDTAVPAIDRLLEEAPKGAPSPYIGRDRIAGFASLGYRLSPHPEFPQDPAATPPQQLRAARHPDHIQDVWAALAALARDGDDLQDKDSSKGPLPGSPADYIARGRYVVYGHSCGAFLAFQLWTTEQTALQTALSPLSPPSSPACVVGLEGIYDLRGLVDRGGSPAHGGGPGTGFAAALQEIAGGAFGRDRRAWDEASPGRFDWRTTPDERAAPGGGGGRSSRLAVLAHSPEDELVDGGEIDTMEAALRRRADADERFQLVALRDLRGRHDEVREDGREVARVLAEALRRLDHLQADRKE